MDYKGKKFTDLTTGKIVEVKDHFEDVAVLDNGSRIRVNRLLDKSFFEDYIDPQSFFKNDNLLNTFAQKIRQIPESVIQNMNESATNQQQDLNNISGSTSVNPIFDEPAVFQSDPELEKEELMRKYGIKNNPNATPVNPINAAQQQLEKFKNLLEEPNQEEPVQKVEIERDEQGEVTEVIVNTPKQVRVDREVIQPVQKVDDPIITMFKNVKRNTDFKIELIIENKIPRADFIEMMEDSYNTSIIDFLAQEFTDNLLKNPDIIKEKIKDKINSIVYKKESKVEKINDVSNSPLKDVNPQITDGVTQTKPVRKPRPSTSKGEKGFEKTPKKETSK